MTQIATNPGADIRPVARTSRVRLWIVLAAAAVVSPFLRPFFLGTPLAGEWWVGHGGHAELVNYHQTRSTQRDALDIMQVVDGSIHRRPPRPADRIGRQPSPHRKPARDRHRRRPLPVDGPPSPGQHHRERR